MAGHPWRRSAALRRGAEPARRPRRRDTRARFRKENHSISSMWTSSINRTPGRRGEHQGATTTEQWSNRPGRAVAALRSAGGTAARVWSSRAGQIWWRRRLQGRAAGPGRSGSAMDRARGSRGQGRSVGRQAWWWRQRAGSVVEAQIRGSSKQRSTRGDRIWGLEGGSWGSGSGRRQWSRRGPRETGGGALGQVGGEWRAGSS